MPIDVYVAPAASDGPPSWWQITDHDGLSVAGSFPWASSEMPPDEIRFDGYRVPYGEAVTTWRPATRDECAAALWASVVDDEGPMPPGFNLSGP